MATRGAKDAKRVHDSAKGSKSVAPGVRQEDGVSQGTFSVEASPVAAGKGNTRPRSSSFKMADAKALSRALAKGRKSLELDRTSTRDWHGFPRLYVQIEAEELVDIAKRAENVPLPQGFAQTEKPLIPAR